MAKNDVRIVHNPYNSAVTSTRLVDDRTTTSDTAIYVGEPLKIYGGQHGNYATHMANGDPAIGTDITIGIAASDSTETATAEGTVEVYLPLPGIIYECAATTPANLADGVVLDCVTFDLTGIIFTVDEDEGSDENVHGLRIIGYDATAGTVQFTINPRGTILGDLNA